MMRVMHGSLGVWETDWYTMQRELVYRVYLVLGIGNGIRERSYRVGRRGEREREEGERGLRGRKKGRSCLFRRRVQAGEERG